MTTLQAKAKEIAVAGHIPVTVSFLGTATGGTTPYKYTWRFGDGSIGTVQNPTHHYGAVGTYLPTLTVTGLGGGIAVAKAGTVTALVPPASLSAQPTVSSAIGTAPLTVGFNDNDIGGYPPYSHEWRFGDGAMATIQAVSHTYLNPGTYLAVVRATDSA